MDMDIDMEVDTEEDTEEDPSQSAESDISSDCSESSSITNEIEQLINDLEAIQRTHDLAIQQLQSVTALLSKTESITVIVNGHSHDFCDVMDELHLQSLNEMGGSGFGKKILEWIDSAEIIVPNV